MPQGTTLIFTDEQEIKERVERLTGRKIHGRAEIVEDTTDYMRLLGGMVLRLAGSDYFITGDAREGRFRDRRPAQGLGQVRL